MRRRGHRHRASRALSRWRLRPRPGRGTSARHPVGPRSRCSARSPSSDRNWPIRASAARQRDPRGATVVLRDLAATIRRLSPRGAPVWPSRSSPGRPTGKRRLHRSQGRLASTCAGELLRPLGDQHARRALAGGQEPEERHPGLDRQAQGRHERTSGQGDLELRVRQAEAGSAIRRSHHGGNPNSKIDIFIQDVGRFGLYGYCTTDDPRYRRSERRLRLLRLRRRLLEEAVRRRRTGVAALKVTAAHEFNHADPVRLRRTEDRGSWRQPRPTWRPTSTRRSTTTTSTSPRARSARRTPRRPIDLFAATAGTSTASWIFFRFLCEYFADTTHPIDGHAGRSIVREIWKTRRPTPGTNDGGKYSTQAIADHRSTAVTARTSHDLSRSSAWQTPSPAAWYKDGDALSDARDSNADQLRLDRDTPEAADTGDDPHVERLRGSSSPAPARRLVDHRRRLPECPVTAPRATVLVLRHSGGA